MFRSTKRCRIDRTGRSCDLSQEFPRTGLSSRTRSAGFGNDQNGHQGMNVEAQAAPVDDTLIEELLRGSIDLHIHTGPSVMKRKIDHLQEIEEAEAAGMKAILLKDHLHCNTPTLEIVKRHRNPQSELHLLSGVPCNNALGGLN